MSETQSLESGSSRIFSTLRMLMLAAVVIVLAFSFPAANRFYDSVNPPSEFAALDAMAAHNLNALRAVTADEQIEALDPSGVTPLIMAVRLSNDEAVADLLARGADVNHGTDDFGSPLMTALVMGNAPLARVLLAHRANIEYHTPSGDSALLSAIRGANRECVDLILAAGVERYATPARSNPINEATTDESADLLEYLLSLKFDPNRVGRDGVPPIVSAAGSLGCVKALLTAGADPERTDRLGRDAWTTAMGHPEAQRLLRSSHTAF